jgi:hypothetical protein
MTRSGALRVLLLLTVIAAVTRADASDFPSASPTAAKVVAQMMDSSRRQAEGLKHYSARRHYEISYRGFPARLDAKMEVEVLYDGPHSKSLRIVSTTGSKVLIDRVLKKLVESEREASNDGGRSALSEANYRFQLESTEVLNGREAYVIGVEPIADGKFLYRGKIWVDATDYAVVKIDAEPARRPSLWIAKTRIYETFANVGGFWLPQLNRSETRVRLGGTAVLTIDYGTYIIEPARLNSSDNASIEK